MIRDLRHALRQLARAPAFTAVALVTLALGIGACAAIFSVVNSVLLSPLPFPESDRLVVLNESKPPEFPLFVVRPHTYPRWKEQVTSFDGLAVVRDGSYNLTGAGDPTRVYAGKITANVFPTLRVRPALGRAFTVEEEAPGKRDVVILGHGFWQRQFGGRPEVLFQTIQLDGRPHAVVGVMPRGFQLDGAFDLYTPDSYLVFRADESDNRTIEVFARLKPGVTLEQARAELTLIQRRLAREDAHFEGWNPVVMPMLEAKVSQARPALLALLGAVGFLLLIACANVANLLLARATARAREVAVRAALGATRARLVRQLLTESLVVAALGGLLGVMVARWGLDALLALAPESLPRAQEIAVDGRVLAFTCGLALLTGVGFGLAPAFVATRLDLHGALKEGGRGTAGGGRRQRLRSALVVTEVATAVVLLVGAGLLIRSFERLQSVPRGFQPQGALALKLALPHEKYPDNAQLTAFAEQVVHRLAALPGVTAAGAVQDLPFSGGLNIVCLRIPGRPTPTDCERTRVYTVTPDYFGAMGIRLLRGRLFNARDWASPESITLINESLARRYWPGQDPIGKHTGTVHHPEDAHEIVGVVADVRDDELSGDAGLQAYAIFAQHPAHSMTFVVRGTDAGLPAAARAAIHAVDASQAIASIRPLEELVARTIARERFAMLLFAVFSAVALVLAAVGVYGVVAYSVAQRTGEIGVRMALGAQVGDVLALVLRQGGALVAAGLLAGLLAALALSRVLTAQLFGVSPHDPLTFAAIAVLLAVVAAVACLIPALRATRVDPMAALRSE